MLPVRGRAPAPIFFEVLGELTPLDLLRLQVDPGEERNSVPLLKKVREIHHRQARLIATGMKQSEVALRCDTTPARINQLMADPSFQNLVAYYREQAADRVISAAERLQDRLTDIGELVTDEIQNRLEDPKERAKLKIGDLRQLGEFALDRSVAPPRNAQPTNTAPIAITFNIPGKGLNKPGEELREVMAIEVDEEGNETSVLRLDEEE